MVKVWTYFFFQSLYLVAKFHFNFEVSDILHEYNEDKNEQIPTPSSNDIIWRQNASRSIGNLVFLATVGSTVWSFHAVHCFRRFAEILKSILLRHLALFTACILNSLVIYIFICTDKGDWMPLRKEIKKYGKKEWQKMKKEWRTQ